MRSSWDSVKIKLTAGSRSAAPAGRSAIPAKTNRLNSVTGEKKMHRMILLILMLTLPAGLLSSARESALEWRELESGVSVPVPPAVHPRVFLRQGDIADLRARVRHPLLEPVWEHLQTLAGRSAQHRITVDAVRYLLEPDSALGRRTIEAALDTLRLCTFPDMQDVSRDIGRLMVAGAIVYDWCYELLSAREKEEFVNQFIRLASEFEIGYPIRRSGSLTGHLGEWMVMRDMLSAGLAIFDEYPDMYYEATDKIFGSFIPSRNWFYPGHAYHQGIAYGDTRFGSELYPLWIFDRLGTGNIYHPAQQFVPYHWIYMRRPDGKLMTTGDDFIWSPKLSSLLCASYYNDGYILADYLKDEWHWEYLKHANHPLDELFELLWRDPELKPRDLDELPLTRYFGSPYGWMVARTGWDSDAVICEMKVNEWNYGNHQHLDAGAFQIYYRGPLALDSGIYEGTDGGYVGPHNVNYYKRTIAHNSLLVFDPAEDFITAGFRRIEKYNDGGQRMPNRWISAGEQDDFLRRDYRTGEVLGRWLGPDPHSPAFSYLKGDITDAYSDKVSQVQRSFVFINRGDSKIPAALAVLDRVTSRADSFRKYWLLHGMEQPQVRGETVRYELSQRGWDGALVNTTILPESDNLVIETVGGPGREFDVFGKNLANGIPERHDPGDYELGEWRV
ncbi:MAG: heparinase, partial [Candidatus Glassbacteria bacterium]|nr:heparinase [Candidatus Glassbacteria bacterium]